MASKVRVERHQDQIRIVFEEQDPDAPKQDGVTITVARHWDLPITHALQLASALSGEAANLLLALARQRAARTEPSDKAINGAPRSPVPCADPAATPAEPGA